MKSAPTLRILGLSHKQEKVLGALMQKPSTPLHIARTTHISRPTVYAILQNLKKRGLVQSQIVAGKKQWKSSNAKKIEEICVNLKLHLMNAPSGIQEVATDSTHVIIHHGPDAVRKALHDFFTNPQRKRLRGLQGDTANTGWMKYCTPEEIAEHNAIMRKNKLVSEALLPNGWIETHAQRLGTKWLRSQQGRARRTNILPSSCFAHKGHLIISDDAIYLLSLCDDVIIEIKNVEVRKMLTLLFEFIQDNSPTIDSNALYKSLLEQALARDSR